MSDRQGIEIDYCPQCRGVWLDRGELDKIIERSMVAEGTGQSPLRNPSSLQHGKDHHRSGHHDDHREHDGHGYNRHGRKSIWKELFD